LGSIVFERAGYNNDDRALEEFQKVEYSKTRKSYLKQPIIIF
jgi:hypothetical protein